MRFRTKISIVSIATQMLTQRLGSNPISAFAFALELKQRNFDGYVDVDASADV